MNTFFGLLLLSPLLLIGHVNADGLRSMVEGKLKDCSYKYKMTLTAPVGGFFTGSGSRRAIVGCGSNNHKCTCSVTSGTGATEFVMDGEGTCGTWTGLEYECNQVRLEIPDAVAGCQIITMDFHARIGHNAANSVVTKVSPAHCHEVVTATQVSRVRPFDNFINQGQKNYSPEVTLGLSEAGKVHVVDYASAIMDYVMVASGAEYTLTTSVTHSTTNSVANTDTLTTALTAGLSFQVGDAATSGVAVTGSVSNTWTTTNTFTHTYTQTVELGQTETCRAPYCRGGIYQLRATYLAEDGSDSLEVRPCVFECTELPSLRPMCPWPLCGDDHCTCCVSAWIEGNDNPEDNHLCSEHT